jgi:predicted Zn-dependent protease
MNRRQFLKYTGLTTATAFLNSCGINPVTGESQLMLVSEDQEIALDKSQSPHQFSADYGVCQDKQLNAYLNKTGRRIAKLTHRPQMPYSFRCVNAVYVNAYAFPGGSIAATRGILVRLENEAELAALMGHELGHVNARHTAQQMSKGSIVQALALGISEFAASQNPDYGKIASRISALGAGALLAHYSRDHERQADALGCEYMTRAGYNPDGELQLLSMLNQLGHSKANAIQLMFASHPMSSERLADIRQLINSKYGRFRNLSLFKERYMDNTKRLRARKGAIETMEKAEKEIGKKQFATAEKHLKTVLKPWPHDYTALVLMTKCLMMQKKDAKASKFATRAVQTYPGEGQGHYLSGLLSIKHKKFAAALNNFSTYDRLLPGNPQINFFMGRSLDGMGRIDPAARRYYSFLQSTRQGQEAEYAYNRLIKWGYIKPPKSAN